MALHKLDSDGKPIQAGSRKRPAVDGEGRFHWRYQHSKTKKRPLDMTRHFWARDQDVAAIVEAFWENKPASMANGLTWRAALDEWQNGHRLASRGHVETLARNIDYLCEYYNNKNLTIEETTRGMFRRWLNSRADVSGATANKSREIIAVAKYAWEELEILDAAPACLGVGKLEVEEKKKRAIPVDVISAYLAATREHYGDGLTLIVEFILFSGVRSTEAGELTEDRAGNEITVLQKAKGAGKREADVVADQYVMEILARAKKHKARFVAQAEKEIEAAKSEQDTFSNDRGRLRRCQARIDKLKKHIENAKGPQVFINSAGSPWNKDSLRRHWKACCEKAGLEYFVPHELRHTHATMAGGAGFSERFIQAAMRWDDPAMAKRYVHETSNMAAEVAASVRGTLAEALGRKKVDHKIVVEGLATEVTAVCPCCKKPLRLVPKPSK